MTATPEPPPEGWTLPEATAALFPDAWSAAWFPDDVTAARTLPGIEPAPAPWSQVPLDKIASVTAAVMAGSAIPAGLEAVVAACRSYEAETSQRIAAAMVRRAEQRAALPGLLAARLAGGAFMARGVSPSDPLRPVDIPALAWGTAQIALGWEETTWRRGAKPYSSHGSPPPAPGSVTLPGGITLLGVRVFAANRTLAPTVEVPAVTPEMPAPTADSMSALSGRSGFAGRPSSQQLIELEHARRLAAGEAEEKITDEAQYLSAWLARTHPEWPKASAKTIANNIGAAHRRGLKSRPK
ncbi:MAG: hypothetical protein ACKO54_19055 [Alphaproteobacteria bacterium]